MFPVITRNYIRHPAKKSGWFVTTESYQSRRIVWGKNEFFPVSSGFKAESIPTFGLNLEQASRNSFVCVNRKVLRRTCSFLKNSLLFFFADSDWKLLALPAKKLAPSLSKLLLRVQRKFRCRIVFWKFLNFFDTSLVNDLPYLLFFFRFFSKKFSRPNFSRRVLRSALYVFKRSCLKKFLQNLLRLLKSFSDIERNFSGLSPKKLSSNCRNIPPRFQTITLKKKSLIFSHFLFRIEQKDFRLLSKTLGSVIVTSFCLSRGEFHWKLFSLKKAVFLQCQTLGECFFDAGEKMCAEVSKLQSMCPDGDFREFFLRGANSFFCFGTLNHNYRSLAVNFWRSCQNCMVHENNLRKRLL